VSGTRGNDPPGVRECARAWFALSLVGLACAVFLVLVAPANAGRIIGVAGVAFFGTVSNALHRRVRAKAPKWETTAWGVSVEGSPFGLIEWRDVERAYLWRQPTAELLCLCVRDPSKYTERLSRSAAIDAVFGPNLGRRTLVIDVSNSDTQALLRAIRTRVR
jgi:hypothetical protein